MKKYSVSISKFFLNGSISPSKARHIIFPGSAPQESLFPSKLNSFFFQAQHASGRIVINSE
jgi:hypothetical protein